MQLEVSIKGEVLIVRTLATRFDAKVSAEFKEEMAKLIADGSRLIILNLSNVDFIDSSGLGAIVASLKQLGGEGDLVLCGIKESIFSLFRLTRLDRVFKIVSSEEEALTELSN